MPSTGFKALMVALLSLGFSHSAMDARRPNLQLRLPPQAILELVARQMGIVLDAAQPLPTIRVASPTPLIEFQQALAAQ